MKLFFYRYFPFFLVLILLLLAQGANASNNITIVDHYINIDGVRKFPVVMWEACNIASAGFDTTPATCASNFSDTINFTWKLGTQTFPNRDEDTWYQQVRNIYENNYTYWATHYYMSQRSWFLQNYSNGTYFFGWNLIDEPLTEQAWSDQTNNSIAVRQDDTTHPINIALYNSMGRASGIADVMHFSGYNHCKASYCTAFTPVDFLYYQERRVHTDYIGSNTSLDDIASNKTNFALAEAWGKSDIFGAKFYPLNASESRAQSYNYIVLGFKGIEWWGQNSGESNNRMGIAKNTSLLNQYNSLADEIRSLEPILILNTSNYSWTNHVDNRITFSNNPTKTANAVWGSYQYLNYMLKQNATTGNYYLFVVNKDINQTTTSINITGMSASMNAMMLGNQTSGSASEHKTVPLAVTNGNFTDTFDGYAAHIYEISNATAGEESDPSTTWTTGIGNTTNRSFFQNSTIGSNRTCINQGDGSIQIGYICDNFNDNNTIGWNETGDLTGTWIIQNGTLNQSISVSSYQYWNVSSYENMSIFTKFKTDNFASYIDGGDLRGNLSRVNTNPSWLNYQFSVGGSPQNRTIIYAYDGTDWQPVNITATEDRTLNQWNYTFFKIYGTTVMAYIGSSYSDALLEVKASNSSTSVWLNGTTIQFGAAPASGATISWDEIRAVELDAQGNQYLQGNYSMNYTVPASQYAKNITVNGSYPSGTNYSVWYRQNGTGSYTTIGGVKTADTTIELPTPYHQSIDIMLEMNVSQSDTLSINTITVETTDSDGVTFIPPSPINGQCVTSSSPRSMNCTWQPGET